jgi:hypothetical protein
VSAGTTTVRSCEFMPEVMGEVFDARDSGRERQGACARHTESIVARNDSVCLEPDASLRKT